MKPAFAADASPYRKSNPDVLMVVCTKNSDSHVVAMQSAKGRMGRDAIDPLNRAGEWRVFVKRSVRSQIRRGLGLLSCEAV